MDSLSANVAAAMERIANAAECRTPHQGVTHTSSQQGTSKKGAPAEGGGSPVVSQMAPRPEVARPPPEVVSVTPAETFPAQFRLTDPANSQTSDSVSSPSGGIPSAAHCVGRL